MPTPEEEAAEIAFYKAEMKKLSDTQSAARAVVSQQIEKEASKAASLYRYYAVPGTTSIYVSVAQYLKNRGGWTDSASSSGIDLLLGAHTSRAKHRGMSAGGINFSCLSGKSVGPSGQRVLVNRYRGFELACSKVDQVATLKRWCEANGTDPWEVMPETFVFRPARSFGAKTKSKANETEGEGEGGEEAAAAAVRPAGSGMASASL